MRQRAHSRFKDPLSSSEPYICVTNINQLENASLEYEIQDDAGIAQVMANVSSRKLTTILGLDFSCRKGGENQDAKCKASKINFSLDSNSTRIVGTANVRGMF